MFNMNVWKQIAEIDFMRSWCNNLLLKLNKIIPIVLIGFFPLLTASWANARPTNVLVVCDVAYKDQVNGCHPEIVNMLYSKWLFSDPVIGSKFKVVPVASVMQKGLEYEFKGWISNKPVGAQKAAHRLKFEKEVNHFFKEHRSDLKENPLGYQKILESLHYAIESIGTDQKWTVVLISNLRQYSDNFNFAKGIPHPDVFEDELKNHNLIIDKKTAGQITLHVCGYSPQEYIPENEERETRTSILVVCDNSGSADRRCNRRIISDLFYAWVENTCNVPGSSFKVLHFDPRSQSIYSPIWFQSTIPERSGSFDSRSWATEELERLESIPPQTSLSPIAECIWNATNMMLQSERTSKNLLIIISDMRQESVQRGPNCPRADFSRFLPEEEQFLNWLTSCGYLSEENKGVINDIYICGFHTMLPPDGGTITARYINQLKNLWRRYFSELGVTDSDSLVFNMECNPSSVPWPPPVPVNITPGEWELIKELWIKTFKLWGFESEDKKIEPALSCDSIDFN